MTAPFEEGVVEFPAALTSELTSETFNVPLLNGDGHNDTHKVKEGH